MRELTALEEAKIGNYARLVAIYARTITRARDRKLLPAALVFGLKDDFGGHRTMAVFHEGIAGSGFFAAQVYAPTRDEGRSGGYYLPPIFFKEYLRDFIAPPPEETRH